MFIHKNLSLIAIICYIFILKISINSYKIINDDDNDNDIVVNRFKRKVKYDWQFDNDNPDELDTDNKDKISKRTYRIEDIIQMTNHGQTIINKNDNKQKNYKNENILDDEKTTSHHEYENQSYESDIKEILWFNNNDHNEKNIQYNKDDHSNRSNHHNHINHNRTSNKSLLSSSSNDTITFKILEKEINKQQEIRESSHTTATSTINTSHIDNKNKSTNSTESRSANKSESIGIVKDDKIDNEEINSQNVVVTLADNNNDDDDDAGSDNDFHDIESDNHQQHKKISSVERAHKENEDINSDGIIISSTTINPITTITSAPKRSNGITVMASTSSTKKTIITTAKPIKTTMTTAKKSTIIQDKNKANIADIVTVDEQRIPIQNYAYFESMLSINEDKLRTYTLNGNERYGIGKAKPKHITENLSRMPIIEYNSKEIDVEEEKGEEKKKNVEKYQQKKQLKQQILEQEQQQGYNRAGTISRVNNNKDELIWYNHTEQLIA